jgi:hypothetical protein
MQVAPRHRAPVLVAISVALILVAGLIAYRKARPARIDFLDAGDQRAEEVGDMRYTLVCDVCGGRFELSATDFAQQFSEASKGGHGLKCARCGALRAHLETIAPEQSQIDLPPEVRDSPEKIEQLVHEKYARIAELGNQLADPNLKNDPERRNELNAEYERLHLEAEALARRWFELVPAKEPTQSATRPRGDR